MEGQVYTFFFPGLTQGTSGYKVLEFCFPKVLGSQETDTLPVVEILPLSQHSWTFQPRTARVQYQQVKVSSKIWGFYLPEVPRFVSFGGIVSLTSGSQYCHQQNTADFLIKLHL